LTPERPGILLIIDNNSWAFDNPVNSNLNLKHQLDETVYDYTTISALIVLTNYVVVDETQKEFIMEDESFISMQIYNPKTLFTRNKLIILNKYSKYPLTNEEREMLKSI